MNCVTSDTPFEWGNLDLPLFGITHDWGGKSADPPAAWSLAKDPKHLWFVAGHSKPAQLHPKARPGLFLAELWKYDVAELFLADPHRGTYLEFNLAPNGAWWNAEFASPRVRREKTDVPMPQVATYAELSPDGGWLAAIAIPLESLQAQLDFGESTTANVSFILGSPDQRFLSATDLGAGEPDFHRPERFANLRFLDADLFPSPPPP